VLFVLFSLFFGDVDLVVLKVHVLWVLLGFVRCWFDCVAGFVPLFLKPFVLFLKGRVVFALVVFLVGFIRVGELLIDGFAKHFIGDS
jgi:hypothetical protein